MSATHAPAVSARPIPGRGIGLIATRDIAAGECVLRERATVCGTSAGFRDSACARCLAFTSPIGGALFTCAICGLAKLCGGDTCSWSGKQHGKVACFAEGLSKGLQAVDVERLRFLAACADLRAANDAESFARLSSINDLCPSITPHGDGIEERERNAADRLHPVLEQAVALALAGQQVGPNDALDTARRTITGTVFTTAFLLSRETKNTFGAMAPRDESGERRVRGGALYHLASRVNHSCFPNTARFDNFDGTLNDGSQFLNVETMTLANEKYAPDELRLYALDIIPQGTEVTMSYLPVTDSLARRRRRLRNTFGFDCACERCVLECGWAREDGDRVGDVSEESSSSGNVDGIQNQLDDEDDARIAGLSDNELMRRSNRIPGEYAIWLLRNVCPKDECGGTLAPPNTKAEHMTCNACGYKRSDAEFFKQLEG